jgi:hypothetical protein
MVALVMPMRVLFFYIIPLFVTDSCQSHWPNPGCDSKRLRNSDLEVGVTGKSNFFVLDDIENTEN